MFPPALSRTATSVDSKSWFNANSSRDSNGGGGGGGGGGDGGLPITPPSRRRLIYCQGEENRGSTRIRTPRFYARSVDRIFPPFPLSENRLRIDPRSWREAQITLDFRASRDANLRRERELNGRVYRARARAESKPKNTNLNIA